MRRILFTSIYKDKNPIRQKELDLCLIMNIKNDDIHEIRIFVEGDLKSFPYLDNEKVHVILGKRPTYYDFFKLANEVCSPKDICIFSNTDILFDESIKLVDRIKENECFALSRYDYQKNGGIILHDEKWSQDVWIFKGGVKRNILVCDFYMGIPGCDNRIAYEIQRAGYFLRNPALSIRTIHYHLSDLHTYSDKKRIAKPYLPVPLTIL